MDDAALICARLLRDGVVKRDALKALDLPDTRSEVERRLGQVGLTLATSAYSDYVGLHLSRAVASDPSFDTASNLGLNADACALLVILWARLVLQKRTAQDTRQVPGQAPLLPDEQQEAARRYEPQVQLEAIVQEFGRVLGSRSHLRTLVGQLRRLRFLGGHGDLIEAGPLLELGIDGEQMIAFIRRGVLSQLLAEKEAAADQPAQPAGGPVAAVLECLRARGGPVSIQEVAEATELRRELLREILQAQLKAKRVCKVGNGRSTRYQFVSVPEGTS